MTPMMTLTDRQRDFARHAVGFDGRSKTTYRNHFVIDKDGDGWSDWMDMVAKGYARHRPGSEAGELSGGMDVFWVTRETALFIRNNDEHLGRDFRE